MQNYRKRRGPQPVRKQRLNLVLNSQAHGFSETAVEQVKAAITDSGGEYFIINAENVRELIFRLKKALQFNPAGMIVCGGDGTVNLVGRHLIRRTCPLGIIPMGKFNNIYRSLYGASSIDKAIKRILSGRDRRIDQGLAGGYFFLGSAALGFTVELHNGLANRRLPRFGIGWSRTAAACAAGVKVNQLSIKIDSFAFEFSPIMFNVNLLAYSAGLPVSTAGIDDDGKAEVIFDIGQGKAIFSSYARMLVKGKYLYADPIRMYRGTKIVVGPVDGRKLYVDGDLHDIVAPELGIEIFPKRIRVFDDGEG
jgi:diacylglycerol kinase family enzyme